MPRLQPIKQFHILCLRQISEKLPVKMVLGVDQAGRWSE